MVRTEPSQGLNRLPLALPFIHRLTGNVVGRGRTLHAPAEDVRKMQGRRASASENLPIELPACVIQDQAQFPGVPKADAGVDRPLPWIQVRTFLRCPGVAHWNRAHHGVFGPAIEPLRSFCGVAWLCVLAHRAV